MNAKQRLSILSQKEQDELYAQPTFKKDDRPLFFSLSDQERAYVDQLRRPEFKAYFLLQLAYFKAKQRLFDIDLSKAYQDLRYLKKHVLDREKITADKVPSKNVLLTYRAKILELTGYREVNGELEIFADESARRSLKPRAIFSEILDYLREQKFVTPPYSVLCDLVGRTVSKEHKHLGEIAHKKIAANKAPFENFLKKSSGCYDFSMLRRDSKSLGYKDVKEELARHKLLGDGKDSRDKVSHLTAALGAQALQTT